jgi:hypothetical protein
MCEKCIEIDKRIEHYQRLSSNIDDQRVRDGIKGLIASLEAQKVELHPERKE